MYDLVGDIHGHGDELIQLLERLGYQYRQGVFRHPERKVIFLGDFIDRGPNIRQVLQLVRSMVESDSALTVLGNHELNALAYHTQDPEAPGEYLRRHTPNNDHQIKKTIQQLTYDEFQSALDWFRTIPLWLDLEGFRVVHACWDDHAIAKVRPALDQFKGLTDEFLQIACRPGKSLFDPVEILLKGKEAALPEGMVLVDSDGQTRKKARVRWYSPPAGHTFQTYTLTDKTDNQVAIERYLLDEVVPYPADAKPVFFGHYSMLVDQPEVLRDNVACLDFGIARGGSLCAYRWDGEQTLSSDKFVRIARR